MSEAKHLAEALDGFLTNDKNGWFLPIRSAIQGLTAEQAACIPAKGFNSVWGVVNHLIYWNEIMSLRLEGHTVDRKNLPNPDSWPKPAIPATEDAWKRDCERLFAIHKNLVEYTARQIDETLSERMAPGQPKRWQVIQGIIAHNSYHTCEIISIRHMQGLWLEGV